MENKSNESNSDSKPVKIEKGRSSPDFIPLKSSSNEDFQNAASNQNNGNGEKNVYKRIKTEFEDGNGKKPRKSPPECHEIAKNPNDIEEYYLTLSNLPKEWSFVKIKNYLDNLCGVIDEMEMINLNNSQYCTIRLTFQSDEKCRSTYHKLKNAVIEENKLEVEISGDTSQAEGSDVTDIIPLRPWRPDEDMWDTDPQGLYGLRPQFLKSLNITPPIDKWVHVTNFRCDKSELKEVMELAGNVLMCCVVTVINRYAKVMYSHPLEAVQAISMLNGQMYYGKQLKVSMDRNPADVLVLPKGLTNVGVGLGLGGRPVRNIAHHCQRYARKQSSLINPVVFTKINTSTDDRDDDFEPEENEEEIQRKIDALIKSPPPPMQVKNVDEMSSYEMNSQDGSFSNFSEPNVSNANFGDSRKSSISSVTSQKQDATAKIGSSQNDNLIKPLPDPAAPIRSPIIPSPSVSVRVCEPRSMDRPGLRPLLPICNAPIPTPGHPNFRPSNPPNFANPMGPYGPRTPNFMPRPGFGGQPMPQPMPQPMSQPMPQPMPPGYTTAPGVRPQVPPMNFTGPQPYLSPKSSMPRPSTNTGNHVTVHFKNLPPTTTFPLLCDKLAHCGQVISVQLTTPGCAIATFAHPSHAERCFQTFNGMNVDGFVIEVKYA